MTFHDALELHLKAIQARDLEALADTVDPEEVVLVNAAGEICTRPARFLDLHRDWFASDNWTLDAEVLHVREGSDLATCLLWLDYREDREDGPFREESVLSLVFQRRNGRWLMVQDQNTPVRR